jgi:hypothetical protein
VSLGYVGDIEFWAPNRGLLIEAGSGIVPMGLYAYNGVSWHLLSTVCGGVDGRIAWAAPDEFWTIADQRPGQILTEGGAQELESVSLCHFLDGQVVASYALPLEQPDSYQPMNAAACDSPSDCWFAGNLNSLGAFHLHWNGSTVSVLDAPQDHEVASLTVLNDEIYESVQLGAADAYGTEDPLHPPVLHLIAPWDPSNPFHDLFPTDSQNPVCGQFCPPLPEYGTGPDPVTGVIERVAPVTEGGFALSSDWRAGATDPQLWAAAAPSGANPPNPGEGTPAPIVLRYADGAWTQVVGGTSGLLPSLGGDYAPIGLGAPGRTPVAQSVAAEPDESAAWIAVVSQGSPDNDAHVVRVVVGPSGAQMTDTDTLGPDQGVGPRGEAAAIACPAADDCWLATQQGWLFHLTNGTQYPEDTDPNFAGMITFRPSDAGVPAVIPPGLAFLNQPGPPPPISSGSTGTVTTTGGGSSGPSKPLVTHESPFRILKGTTTLVVSFTLTARARVQLIATRHRKVVAATRRAVMGPGRHTLHLVLDIHRWPTGISLTATRLAGSSPSSGGGGGGGGGGGPTVITT